MSKLVDSKRQETEFCEHCNTDTLHTVYYSGHERDMSNDWRTCMICHWRWNGLNGEYAPPESSV